MPAFLTRSLGFAAVSADSLNMLDDHTSQSSSLRRTLSADMSSEKWISQSALKKVASLDNLHFKDDEDDNGGPGFGSGSGSGAFEDIWSSIQTKQEEEEETEKPRSQTDIWSSILSQKAINEQDENNTGANLPPPYVHPLVKRSASSLSEKSLEICTESLGSETGSDCFSPEPACDSDQEEYKEVVEGAKEITGPLLQQQQQEMVVVVVKTKSAGAAGAPVRSFPPPLPSLAHRGDGSNVQMRSHRQDGRLVLEAVSVPSNNCFKAERQDGRLLLTFSGRHVSDSERSDVEMVENMSTEDDEEEVCDVTEDSEEEDQETDLEEEEEGYDDVDMADDELACGDGGIVSYVAAGHKFLGLTRNMATWPRRLNTVVNTLEQSTATALARSLPLRTQMTHGLNPYVYSWRSKPGRGPTVVVVVEGKRAGKVEEDVFLKGCSLQQPKRSVLLWEPHCIATS